MGSSRTSVYREAAQAMSLEYTLPKLPLESTRGCKRAPYPRDRRTMVS